MKVILEPTVHAVAATQFLGHPIYKIPPDGSDATKLSSFAAKGCYDSFGENGRSNIENQNQVLQTRHGSVLEHFYISLFITGITRGLSIELNRHRHFAISQRSTRYTAEEDAAIVLEPYYAELFRKYNPIKFGADFDSYRWMSNDWINKDSPASDEVIILDHLSSSNRSILNYQREVKNLIAENPNKLEGTALRKWARGKARNVLPHNLETRATYTANLREWRWILELRSERHAEAEIRRLVSHHIFPVLVSIAPEYFSDFGIGAIVDGIPELVPNYSKV